MTLNLAPMVDVMMCLIIFFLLASSLVQSELYKVELPWAVAAKAVETSDLGSRVTISVSRATDSDDAAEYVVADWNGQEVVQRKLQPDEVEALLLSRAARAVRENQKLRCVIRADRQVMYKHVEAVLRACGLAKISDIVFSVNEGQAPEGQG